jgi:hypothetical protein
MFEAVCRKIEGKSLVIEDVNRNGSLLVFTRFMMCTEALEGISASRMSSSCCGGCVRPFFSTRCGKMDLSL